MRQTDNYWETPDNVRLQTRTWMPDSQPDRIIVLVHGLGEHSARYEHVARFFTSMACGVLSFDQRGHGKSSGRKGYIPSYEKDIDDIQHFIEEAHHDFSDLPLFLYGHSMGGAIVLYYGLTRKAPITGIISTSPGFGPAGHVSGVKLISANILSKIAPGFTIKNGLDINGISRDLSVVEAYKKDPLVHPLISTSLAMEMIKKGEWMANHSGPFPYPLLLMNGSSDRLVNLDLIASFVKRHPQNLTYQVFDNCYHELHNEPEQLKVLNQMLDWMKKLEKNDPALTNVT